ncbi:unnamed protein product [Leuciscus chuanchicus]
MEKCICSGGRLLAVALLHSGCIQLFDCRLLSAARPTRSAEGLSFTAARETGVRSKADDSLAGGTELTLQTYYASIMTPPTGAGMHFGPVLMTCLSNDSHIWPWGASAKGLDAQRPSDDIGGFANTAVDFNHTARKEP